MELSNKGKEELKTLNLNTNILQTRLTHCTQHILEINNKLYERILDIEKTNLPFIYNTITNTDEYIKKSEAITSELLEK